MRFVVNRGTERGFCASDKQPIFLPALSLHGAAMYSYFRSSLRRVVTVIRVSDSRDDIVRLFKTIPAIISIPLLVVDCWGSLGFLGGILGVQLVELFV